MSTDTAMEIADLEREIERLGHNAGYWQTMQTNAESKAQAMDTVAEQLAIHSNPLLTVFRPIENLHNVTTWEGDAATQSRTRLGTHIERVSDALAMIDGLISDLEVEAGKAHSHASDAEGLANYYRTQLSYARGDLWTARKSL